jgi:hypothetical protein
VCSSSTIVIYPASLSSYIKAYNESNTIFFVNAPSSVIINLTQNTTPISGLVFGTPIAFSMNISVFINDNTTQFSVPVFSSNISFSFCAMIDFIELRSTDMEMFKNISQQAALVLCQISPGQSKVVYLNENNPLPCACV